MNHLTQSTRGPTVRLTRIAIGYVAACFVAAIIVIMTLLFFNTSQRPFVFDLELVRTTALMTTLVSVSVAVLGFLPFLVAIAYAERHAINTPTWYVVAGAVVGVLALGLNLTLTAPRGGIRLSDLSEHPAFASLAFIATM